MTPHDEATARAVLSKMLDCPDDATAIAAIAQVLQAQREQHCKALCFYCRQGIPVDTDLNHKVSDGLQPKGSSYRLKRCDAGALRTKRPR
jgi:hypothetical protein